MASGGGAGAWNGTDAFAPMHAVTEGAQLAPGLELVHCPPH